MSFTIPTKLGIIACPGSEKFSNEIIEDLKMFYAKMFRTKSAALAKKYNFSNEEVVKKINFSNDLRARYIDPVGEDLDDYTPPDFRIPIKFTRFANGEFKTSVKRTIRGLDIYIVHDVENHYPIPFNGSGEEHILSVNDHVMSLFVTIDAVQQAGANSITVVLPVYPFSRQHKKKGREALTASWFGQVIEQMGVKRIITLDIHSSEIENSFKSLRLENLHASYQVLRKLIKLIDLKKADLVVVSPDTGAVDRNKFYAGNLKKPLALIYKERDYSKVTQSAKQNNITDMRLLGSVEGKDVFMADDLIGTGGTLIKAMRFLKEMGAKRIICGVSLPLFTGDAIKYFDEAYSEGLFYRVIGTNAIFHDETLLSKEWYESTNVCGLFARIISRLHHDRGLSPLLDNSKIIQSLFEEDELSE